MRRFYGGFTIAELITVIAIVAVLASVTVPITRFASRRENELLLRKRLQAITVAIDRYNDLRSLGLIKSRPALMQGSYPKDLDELSHSIELIDGKRLTLLPKRQLVDPITRKAKWITRSTSDEPDSVSTDGANVFDVHSTSAALSMDGKTRYNEW